MKYIVHEYQTYEDGRVGTITNDYDRLEDAESKWHSILSAAAVSDLPCHTAVLTSADAQIWRAEHYEHTKEATE